MKMGKVAKKVNNANQSQCWNYGGNSIWGSWVLNGGFECTPSQSHTKGDSVINKYLHTNRSLEFTIVSVEVRNCCLQYLIQKLGQIGFAEFLNKLL